MTKLFGRTFPFHQPHFPVSCGYFPFFPLKHGAAFWPFCPFSVNPLNEQRSPSKRWACFCFQLLKHRSSLTPIPKNLTPVSPLATKKHLLPQLSGILEREAETLGWWFQDCSFSSHLPTLHEGTALKMR